MLMGNRSGVKDVKNEIDAKRYESGVPCYMAVDLAWSNYYCILSWLAYVDRREAGKGTRRGISLEGITNAKLGLKCLAR